MELSTIRGLSELGMEDSSFMNQWNMGSLDNFNILPMSTSCFGENLQVSMEDRPSKQLKPDPIWSTFYTQTNNNVLYPNTNQMVTISKPKEELLYSQSVITSTTSFPSDQITNQNHVIHQGTKRVGSRLAQAQDHIIAERKRREKLSQRFIALSSIIPGLKKMDKASVLGDTIKYLKQLQEKVKRLEEQTSEKRMESVVYVSKCHVFDNEKMMCSDGDYLPEIEAKFCDKHVLVRVHCEKTKGLFEKTVSELEKLHLTIINTSVMSFGTSALDITIIAQMDVEFNMSAKDLVKNLKSAFQLLK